VFFSNLIHLIKSDFEEKEEKRPLCRNLKYLPDEVPIRHIIDYKYVRIGQNDKEEGLVWFENELMTLNQFVMGHYKVVKPERTKTNAWAECKMFLNGEWVSMLNLNGDDDDIL